MKLHRYTQICNNKLPRPPPHHPVLKIELGPPPADFWSVWSPKKRVNFDFVPYIAWLTQNSGSLALKANKGSCTYYVITFGGPERPPPPM